MNNETSKEIERLEAGITELRAKQLPSLVAFAAFFAGFFITMVSILAESRIIASFISWLRNPQFSLTAFLFGVFTLSVFIAAIIHRQRIFEVIIITWERYKIEAILGLFASLFLFSYILEELWINSWKNSGTLRTQFYVLFGIAGLIGLSVAIKRNELMLEERRDHQADKYDARKNHDIERAHDFIVKLSHEHSHIVITASSELWRMIKQDKLPNPEITLIQKSLAAFICSPLTEPHSAGSSSVNGQRGRETANRQLVLDEFLLHMADEQKALKIMYQMHLVTHPGQIDYLYIEDVMLQEKFDEITIQPHLDNLMND